MCLFNAARSTFGDERSYHVSFPLACLVLGQAVAQFLSSISLPDNLTSIPY